jgi:Ni,Fe-hydrogenase III large subunit
VKEKRAKDEEKAEKASVVIADVAVSQGLSKEDVVRKIAEQTATLDSCVAGAKGKLVLRLTINPDGTVKSVQVLSGTIKNGKATQCMLDALKKIRTSATQDGKEGRVVVTLSWR